MPEPVSPLLLQLLDWVESRPRTYAEAMEAWRTSCPRLSVWEDALFGRFVQVASGGSTQAAGVTLTSKGREILEWSRPR